MAKLTGAERTVWRTADIGSSPAADSPASEPTAATELQQALLAGSVLGGRRDRNIWQVLVEGPAAMLRADRLRAVWSRLATRHEALRTVLRVGEGGSVSLDLRSAWGVDLAEMQGGGDLAACLEADRRSGVDPTVAPGWRLRCIATGPDRTAMVWTVHGALVDGRSIRLVMQDFLGLMRDAEVGPAPGPGPVAIARALSRLDRSVAHDIVTRGFSGARTGDRLLAAETGREERQQRRHAILPAGDVARLRAASGAGLGPAILAAWAVVVGRWTGAEEVCIGLGCAGRSALPDLDRAVGCLGAMLPLRLVPEGGMDFATLADQVRMASAELDRAAYAGPVEVRRWLGVSGRAPLWEAAFAEDVVLDDLLVDMPGRWCARVVPHAAAPLVLVLREAEDVELSLEYDAARLSPDRAARMLDHVVRLLGEVALRGASRALAAIQMLEPDETARLRALGRPHDPVGASPPCIATRFEAVAARWPQAVAVQEADRATDYATLDRRANALAHELVAAGCGPGRIVAVRLPRGLDFIVAFLAVQKVGAAFLPLDVTQPEAWLLALVTRSGADFVIAEQGWAGLRQLSPEAGEAATPPPRTVPADGAMAYVLFTSGSTGEPKAVMGLAAALSAHADAVRAAYGLGPADRVLHFAGVGFDVSLEEIVPTLLAGAAVVVRTEAAAESVADFIALVAAQAVTVLNLPASFWQVLVEEMAARGWGLPPSVRLMVTGSERVSPKALRLWPDVAPECRWINGYGPTETTITATAWELPQGGRRFDPSAEVPIGRPLGHARVALRAVDGTMTPEGGVGVLWIGGRAVSGGYLGDRDRTRAVFTEDPDDPGGRCYCTGDLASWGPDGQLRFLGRGDRQVKLRGYRVDLHQVETVLSGLPKVRQAHVAIQGTGERGHLVAWVMAAAGVTAAELDRLARQALPAYAVPQIVPVREMPVKANGKIDTDRLPRPGSDGPVPQGTDEADQLSRTVAECMADVLGLPSVAVDVSFYGLGGDSLLALRLASRIQAVTGFALRSTDLYRHPTARSLAALLSLGVQGTRHVVAIQPEGTKTPFYAIHVLGRNEHLFRPLAAALGPDHPVFGISIGIPERLEDVTVERVARVYFDEIQTHQPEGPVALGAVSMATYFAFELAQMLRAAGREVRVLALLDADGPGGRPEVRGLDRLRMHVGQLRRHGLSHLRRALASRLGFALRPNAPQPADAGEFEGFVDFVDANVRAVERYTPRPYGGRLSVFRADDSFWDSPQAIASGLGWDVVASAGFDLYDLPGSHLSILDAGNVAVLAAHLRRLLDEPRPQD